MFSGYRWRVTTKVSNMSENMENWASEKNFKMLIMFDVSVAGKCHKMHQSPDKQYTLLDLHFRITNDIVLGV
jgi:hypothetical protein